MVQHLYSQYAAVSLNLETVTAGLAIVISLGALLKNFGYDTRRLDDVEAAQKRHEVECLSVRKGTIDSIASLASNQARMETNQARIEGKVETGVSDAAEVRRTVQWLGDCIIGIAAKVGASTPERP